MRVCCASQHVHGRTAERSRGPAPVRPCHPASEADRGRREKAAPDGGPGTGTLPHDGEVLVVHVGSSFSVVVVLWVVVSWMSVIIWLFFLSVWVKDRLSSFWVNVSHPIVFSYFLSF